MHYYFKLFLTIFSLSILSACGSGSDWNMNSSFSEKITINGQTYICKSQKDYNACSNNSDCSACTLENPSQEPIINTLCLTPDNGKTYLISDIGCLVPLSNVLVGACTSASLKLLTGKGWSRSQVIDSGNSFSHAGLTLNGTLIKCH
ncbi:MULTISPECIES: hypothetical protein [Acinetobacter]|uniref:Lipoprotein n=1 Tax=Acinetobacter indicus TaxID=756892 RepID=A0A6C0Y6L9_9GAMM|nr:MULTISPECIES: hypothetical protein [Acinetobacter]QIC71750.1 hypothetical protein FSC09_15265 [Acinetobacter indicus]QKQ71658.1 hypothetical protein E5Y90_15625 [Acinetobacter sp. 10FS3-1]